MKSSKRRSAVFLTVLVLFVLSLIPLYAIGFYAHPSVDDYYYGTVTHKVWEDTHSMGEVVSSAVSETIDIYNSWQGNFAAIFLMHIQPGIWGEEYYFLAPVLLITSFVMASVFFFYTAARKIFDAGRYISGITAIAVTFVSMQLLKVPSDSFYWYNGSIYYTFFYSIMLLCFSLLMIAGKKSGVPLIFLGAGSVLTGFLCGAGNYGTALFSAIILSLVAAYATYTTIRGKNRLPFAVICMLTAFACLTALFISMAAPGNASRQASVGGSTGLVKTFIYTFAYGGYSLATALNAPCLVFYICMLPIFYKIAARSRYSFKYPLFVLIFTFGLYCSAGTPVFYAQGLRIPYRFMNIIYFSSYSFFSFNLIYFCGWIERRYGDSRLIADIKELSQKICSGDKSVWCTLIVALFAFLVASIGQIEVTESEYKSGRTALSSMPATISALYSLATGEAKTYDYELGQRDEFLSSTKLKDVEIAPLSAYPELIFHTDITSDASHWKNSHVAMYYDKESVWLSTNVDGSPTP